MIKKHYYSWQDIEKMCVDISLQMYKDNWHPDYIVGITKGGNIPATILCNMLDVRGEALKVSLRDDDEQGPESNLWMAEDAFGYVPLDNREIYKSRWDISRRKKILVVDDINDTGATFNWIKQDWENGCHPNDTQRWNEVWHKSVRFASCIENLGGEFSSDYSFIEINKAEKDEWIVFPWEH